MAMVTGGELLVRTLKAAGVTEIFGLHGAHLESIFQACLDHGVAITDVRHEAVGGYAAEGYARTTRRLGVAMATAGPGFTNMISSIANAYLDRTPVLYLTGASGLREAETNTLQAGIDQVAIAKPITKWAHQITTTQAIPRIAAQAIRMATSGPTGPVMLDLPSDVLNAKIEESEAPLFETLILDSAAAPHARAVDAALKLIEAAERPIIMLGYEAWRSGCEKELKQFVEAAQIPVYTDFQAHGLLPSDHPLWGGTFHKLPDLKSVRPDLVLALGVRFGLFTLGVQDRVTPLAAKFIHVEIDPKELGRLRDPDLAIVADIRETLIALNAASAKTKWPDRSAWTKVITDAKAARKAEAAPLLDTKNPPIHPYQAVDAIAANIPADTIVIGDGAEAYHWLNETIRQTRPGSYITHGFLGCVGFGIGLAIGAQVGNRKRPVLCLAGDGAVGFNIADFDTMARHDLPIVVLVMNNKSWAASQHFQEIVSGANRVSGTQLTGDARYHDVAIALGCQGRLITDAKDLGPAIKDAFKSGKPTCLNVEIDLKPFPPELLLLMSR